MGAASVVSVEGESPVARYAGLIGLAVEFTWAVQESTIVPYLLWLHVPLRFTGFTYLINPIVGVGLQLSVGRLSDALGRRKPFLLGLTITGLFGLLLLMLSYRLGSTEMSVAIVAMIGFAISDVSHDSLLIPARAMIEDLTLRDPERRNELNARFSRFQMIGRLMAMGLGAFPVGYLLDVRWFSKVPETSPSANHLVGLVLLAAIVLICSSATVLWVSPSEDPDDNLAEVDPLLEPNEAVMEPVIHGIDSDDEDDLESLPTREFETAQSLLGLKTPRVTEKSLPWRRATLLTVHFYGWLVTMAKDFYWTAFLQDSEIGVMRVSFIGLGLGALCSFAVSVHLRSLNRRFGSRSMYFYGEIGLMLSLLVLDFSGNGIGTIFVAALSGLSYAVHTNNMFLIVHNLTRLAREHTMREERSLSYGTNMSEKHLGSSVAPTDDSLSEASSEEDEDAEGKHNAWTISLVIAAMPAAQVVVGLFSGFLLEHVFHDDFVAFFTTLAKIGLFVNFAAIIIIHR